MFPQLLHIPGLNLTIYSYGLLLVVAFFCGVAIAKRLGQRVGIDPEVMVNALLMGLVLGVIGARMSHVFENFSEYTRPDRSLFQNLFHMIDLREGGLTFYGGVILATPILIFYGWRKKVPLRLGMDVVAIALMVGLGFGRIGCYFNGCCYGAESAWGVQFPYHSIAYMDQLDKGEISPPAALETQTAAGTTRLLTPEEVAARPQLSAIAAENRARPVLPTELFSAFNAFLLALLLYAYFTLPHAPGRGFALMLILAGGTRFLLEMIRVEPPVDANLFGDWSIAMVTGLAFVGVGAILWGAFGWWHRVQEGNSGSNGLETATAESAVARSHSA
jgi:phosphatidylglycerol:prolipoprotein diacylglycerol transferase